jgi:hypothetical protein
VNPKDRYFVSFSAWRFFTYYFCIWTRLIVFTWTTFIISVFSLVTTWGLPVVRNSTYTYILPHLTDYQKWFCVWGFNTEPTWQHTATVL